MDSKITALAIVTVAALALGITAMYLADRRRDAAPSAYAPSPWAPEYGPGGRADAIYMNGVPVWSRS